MPRRQRTPEHDSRRSDSQRAGGYLIAVSGAAGGVGTTSVAVNTARRLAADPETSVALVDLDLALGDLDLQLDVVPDFTLADALAQLSHLDGTSLKQKLAVHSSGLHLLLRSSDLEELDADPLTRLPRLLDLLQEVFSHVVVDLSKSFSSTDRRVLEIADDLLLVFQQNLVCMRNAGRILARLRDRWKLPVEICLVANRTNLAASTMSTDQEIALLGQAVDTRLPEDISLASQASRRGIPWMDLAPRAELTGAIRVLADRWIEPGESSCSAEETAKIAQWLLPTWISTGPKGLSDTV